MGTMLNRTLKAKLFEYFKGHFLQLVWFGNKPRMSVYKTAIFCEVTLLFTMLTSNTRMRNWDVSS
jgi:hypothetical protein